MSELRAHAGMASTPQTVTVSTTKNDTQYTEVSFTTTYGSHVTAAQTECLPSSQLTPTWSIRKASSQAYCFHASYRPLLPPWPATISVLNRIGRATGSLVTVSRRRATHLAGSTK